MDTGTSPGSSRSSRGAFSIAIECVTEIMSETLESSHNSGDEGASTYLVVKMSNMRRYDNS
jgi:hypothetical protein